MNRKNLIALSLFALVGSNAAFAQAEGNEGYLREYGIDLTPVASSSTARVVSSGTQAPSATKVDAIAARDADYLRKYGIDLRPVHSVREAKPVVAVVR